MEKTKLKTRKFKSGQDKSKFLKDKYGPDLGTRNNEKAYKTIKELGYESLTKIFERNGTN